MHVSAETDATWGEHRGPVIHRVGDFSILDCAVCGFAHATPVPTHDELEVVYREQYYTSEKPMYIERYIEDLAWWRMVYRERLEMLEDVLDERRRRLLDVGSGPGYFLAEAVERGWSATGIEPSSRAVEHSRSLGLTIVDGFLGQETAPDLGTFDVVHLSEVLEHIPDAHDLVDCAVELLRPGGLLFILVPNDESPFQHVLHEHCGYAPWWIAPPHHVNYFSAESLRRLVERHGLEVVHQESTFPIDMFLLMGKDYIGDDAVGRECHGMRKTFELNLARSGHSDLKRALYARMAELGLGREVAVVARRPA
jgi:SAM-dependent methyltransferase